MKLDQYLITVVRKQENVSAKQALLETNVMLALQDTSIAWKPMLVKTMTKCNVIIPKALLDTQMIHIMILNLVRIGKAHAINHFTLSSYYSFYTRHVYMIYDVMK